MNPFVQEMRIVPVQLRIGLGERLHASLRLHQHGTKGSERLLERLNDADRFLPLQVDKEVRIIPKQRISEVHCEELPEEVQEMRTLGAQERQVFIHLRDGRHLSGMLLVLMPGQKQRVLDFLNATQDFFPLVTAEGLSMINKDWIEYVQPNEERS